MRSKYAWWYSPAFLIIELLQALIGLVTLTLYQPIFTTKFASWHHRHTIQKEMEREYGDT